MRWTNALSCLWLFLVLAAVVVTGIAPRTGATERRTPAKQATFAAFANYVNLPSGKRGVADADGQVVEVAPYARIGAGSVVADELVLALLEPERVVSLSALGRKNAEEAHFFGKRATTEPMANLEGLLEQKLDLLFVHNMGTEAQLARARAAGMRIFNLGDMRGLATLIPNIQAVAAVLGVPERGERLAEKLMRRMRGVADTLKPAEKKRALYLVAYANKIYGGTRGTSYYDVLTSAGLIDVAADTFHDWPAYDPEQLLALDPELVVTQRGMAPSVCGIEGLQRLRACADGYRGFVEMSEGLMENAGPTMLEASEALFERVYGSRTP
jgi:iron complex transport system substrate-binding protein